MPTVDEPAASVDRAEAIKGASAGFSVLLVGGVATGLAMKVFPFAGLWWPPLVLVTAYAVAGRRIGDAARPWLHGLAAATGAWLLMLPGRLLFDFGGHSPAAIGVELALALGVGALAGWSAGSRRDRRAARQAQREAEERGQRQAERRAQRLERRAQAPDPRGRSRAPGRGARGRSKGKRR
jgi:hypothetical protein